jgi:hypothetical protein
MVRRVTAAWLAPLLGTLLVCPPVLAEGLLFPGARPLGTGGAMRAVATGDTGPMLNPSGISLMRSYAVEGGYQYGRTLDSHDARISAVDSTSAFNLGGALYYSYHHDSPAAGGSNSGHLAGGSLSFPFFERFYLGTNLKYVSFKDVADTSHSGFTFDGGLTVRLIPQISLGGVAYNLRDLHTAWSPRGYAGGVGVLPMPALLLVFDAVWTKVDGDPARDYASSYMGGGEFSFASSAAVRAGGGRDGLSRNDYISVGLTALAAEVGAVDIGFRQDLSGQNKTTIIGASARLFVPGQ